MKRLILFSLILGLFFSVSLKSQNVAITDDDVYTANSSAMLDVKSLTKGFLTPRLTTAQRNAILTPATGLLVFDTSLNGFYYYNGSTWINLSSGSSNGLLWSYNSPSLYVTSTTDNVGIGTTIPLHKLHVADNVSITDGFEGAFIDIQNVNNNTNVLTGFRFQNGAVNTRFKAGIFYKDVLSFGRGDLIFANNSVAASGNVSTADARLTIKNTGGVEVKATSAAAANASLFHVLNAAGDTIFAVYDGGVRVNVYDDPLAKATSSKGGFAVGGFSPSKGTFTNEYLRVTPDSIRMYIEEGAVNKANTSKGGFAVGGFSPAKATPSDYFNIYGSTAAATLASEARIFWYPIKEAFLAGRVIVQSPDSVGTNSFSTGFHSKAIGNYSQAFGYNARAKGNNSTAIGNNANAEGTESYALGNYAKTTKTGSYAIGSGANASGLNSFAIGSTGVDSAGVSTSATKASGDYSYAFGMGSISSGKGAFTFGTQNSASGDYSTAIGYKNNSANGICLGSSNTTLNGWGPGISIGNDNITQGALGIGIALGFKNNVTGAYTSAAIGYNNYVWGFNCYAFGANGTVGSQSNPGQDAVLFNLDWSNNGTVANITQDNVFSVMNGQVGIGTTSPNSRLHVNSSTGENPLRAQINGISKLLVYNNGGTTIGGTTIPPANGLYVSGNVIINGGTAIKKVQHGTYTVGTGTGGVKTVTVTFPSTFSGTPKVNVTVKGGNFPDVFAVTTRNVGTSSFQVNIYRVDSPGGLWGQSLQLDWFAWE